MPIAILTRAADEAQLKGSTQMGSLVEKRFEDEKYDFCQLLTSCEMQKEVRKRHDEERPGDGADGRKVMKQTEDVMQMRKEKVNDDEKKPVKDLTASPRYSYWKHAATQLNKWSIRLSDGK